MKGLEIYLYNTMPLFEETSDDKVRYFKWNVFGVAAGASPSFIDSIMVLHTMSWASRSPTTENASRCKICIAFQRNCYILIAFSILDYN